MMRREAFASVAALALVAGFPAVAQDYPSETITIVVAYPPGGFNDTVARLIAEDLTERLDATVVVDPEARYFGAALSRDSLVTPDVS